MNNLWPETFYMKYCNIEIKNLEHAQIDLVHEI